MSNEIRVFAYCDDCVVMQDGTTMAAYDIKFDYNNRIGFKGKPDITFLEEQVIYTAQRDGEIIVGNHLDNTISAGDRKEVMIFTNAGHDTIDYGIDEFNLCFGGYGDDYLCGDGIKVGGQQKNKITRSCLK